MKDKTRIKNQVRKWRGIALKARAGDEKARKLVLSRGFLRWVTGLPKAFLQDLLSSASAQGVSFSPMVTNGYTIELELRPSESGCGITTRISEIKAGLVVGGQHCSTTQAPARCTRREIQAMLPELVSTRLTVSMSERRGK
jgi:hypothetical protein